MKLMIDGVWRGDVVPPIDLAALPAIHEGSFRDRVTADGSSGFPGEAGRYHLFVSYACPFAHRVILARLLKGLSGTIGMSIVHPRWNTPDGWVFGETPLSTPDRSGAGFSHLHQAYAATRPDYTGRVTVPVLWDRRTQRIVSNESLDILRILNEAFVGVGGDPTVDLFPAAFAADIDVLNARIAADLASGVYAVAAARNQAAYDAAIVRLFACLDALDRRLADGRTFLHGDRLTASDLLAFTPLIRLDPVYNPLFRASLKRLVDYPPLAAFVRRISDLPGVADTVRFDHIRLHYYDGDWAVAKRRGIRPVRPVMAASEADR